MRRERCHLSRNGYTHPGYLYVEHWIPSTAGTRCAAQTPTAPVQFALMGWPPYPEGVSLPVRTSRMHYTYKSLFALKAGHHST